MTPLEVRAIAAEVCETYDEKTGMPRHTENLANFKFIFEAVGEIRVWMGKINIGVKIGTWLAVFFFGLPAMAASIITIIRFVKEGR